MDWNISWIFVGSMAFLLAIVNLIRLIIARKKGNSLLVFGSLSLGAITVLMQYTMLNVWIVHGEMVALENAVPTMIPILTGAIVVLIALNFGGIS